MTTTNSIHDASLASFREWFAVHETETDIYVTCKHDSDGNEYVVSLEQRLDGQWVASDPHDTEYFATRDEALAAFIDMVDLYIVSAEELGDTLADAAGDHDWITDSVDPADIAKASQARMAVTETIVTALTNHHDYSAAFARHVVSENPQLIAEIVADVMAAVQSREVASVITTPEAAELLGIKPESVQQNCRRGMYRTARQSGGIWLIHRDEVARNA